MLRASGQLGWQQLRAFISSSVARSALPNVSRVNGAASCSSASVAGYCGWSLSCITLFVPEPPPLTSAEFEAFRTGQRRLASSGSARASGLKHWKPTSPGQRFRVTIRREGVWKGKPKRSLTRGEKNHAGRNRTGRITVRHRGGGHKKKLRMVDFKLKPTTADGVVERVEYDPGRTGYIALVKYAQGGKRPAKYSYMLAPQQLAAGDKILSGSDVAIRVGNTLPLRSIPPGIPIYNLELVPGAGSRIVRAAGCSAAILNKTESHATIRLPSGEQRLVHLSCQATIGAVSNPQNKNIIIGKAGYNRWQGRRPSVRGIAMNPVDHPHGGRTNGGRPSCTPWGIPCKGHKTRKPNKVNRFILVSRHKAKRT